MKKILSYFLIAVGCVVLASCSKDDYTEKENSVKVVNANTVIDYKGGDTSIEVTGSGLSATSSANWLTVAVNGNTVKATAAYNDSQESRTAHVTITASNGDKALVAIQQTGWAFDVEVFKLTINDEKAAYDVDVSSAYDIEVSAESDWFTAKYDKANGKIIVNAEANETGVPRTGVIYVKSAGITKEVPVYQAEFDKDVLGKYMFGAATSTAGTKYNWYEATLTSKSLSIKVPFQESTVNVKIPVSVSTTAPYTIKVANEVPVGTYGDYYLYLAFDNYQYNFLSRYASYFFSYLGASSALGQLALDTDAEGNTTLFCEFGGSIDLDGSDYGAISTWYALAMKDEEYSITNNLGYLARFYWPVLQKVTATE